MAQGKLLHPIVGIWLACCLSVYYAYGDNRTGILSQTTEIYQKMMSVQKKTRTQGLSDGLYVFVSFSMPKSLLWELYQQTKIVGGKLLIRGLKNESFKEMIAALKLEQDKILSVDINPKAFALFNVTQVPAFVVLNADNYDIAYGSVSLSYVLNEFAEHGDTKNRSKELLKKLLPNEKP